MKLTSDLVERTLSQYDARVIPENHPVTPQLSRMFGDHTFFIDDDGLSILEPMDPPDPSTDACKVVKLANWAEGGNTLAPHDPEETDVVIVLDTPSTETEH
jgi:hypothetical protein